MTKDDSIGTLFLLRSQFKLAKMKGKFRTSPFSNPWNSTASHNL